MNVVLGAKLLWCLIIGRNDWWKRVLLKKYLIGDRTRSLDRVPNVQSGSQIWKLLRASLSLLQSQLTWIPGNDRKLTSGMIVLWGTRHFIRSKSSFHLGSGWTARASPGSLISLPSQDLREAGKDGSLGLLQRMSKGSFAHSLSVFMDVLLDI